MSDPFNRPPQKNPDEWSELEKDPRFQRLLVQNLQITLVDKKFGPNIVDAHRNLMLRREFENEEGKAEMPDAKSDELKMGLINSILRESVDPLIPEIIDFEQRVKKLRTVLPPFLCTATLY